MRKTISVNHEYGDAVHLKADPSTAFIVTGYLVRNRMVSYLLSNGTDETNHQDVEIVNNKVIKVKGFEIGDKNKE